MKIMMDGEILDVVDASLINVTEGLGRTGLRLELKKAPGRIEIAFSDADLRQLKRFIDGSKAQEPIEETAFHFPAGY